jgi:hypothetical protein
MHITQVIREARNEHALYFLLTAYVEAVGHGRAPQLISEYALQLPLKDRRDVEERCRVLQRKRKATGSYTTAPHRGQLDEVAEIFACAAERLQALEGGKGPRKMTPGFSAA